MTSISRNLEKTREFSDDVEIELGYGAEGRALKGYGVVLLRCRQTR